MQQLLDADAACCSAYSTNLSADATRLRFRPEQLAGCPASFLKDRVDSDNADESLRGDIVLSLKYPDILPGTVIGNHPMFTLPRPPTTWGCHCDPGPLQPTSDLRVDCLDNKLSM